MDEMKKVVDAVVEKPFGKVQEGIDRAIDKALEKVMGNEAR